MSTQVKMSKETHSGGGSTTTKTTTYESSTSYSTESEPSRYRSMIAPRTTIIQRTFKTKLCLGTVRSNDLPQL